MMMNLVLCLLLFFLSSCQQAPTKKHSQSAAVIKAPVAEKLLEEGVVILDTRPAYEFSAHRVPGSISVQWSDFTLHEPESRGVLDSDLYGIARRLALWGIDPDTPVVVLGMGLQGRGEEGRIAWMLQHLGVKRVQTAKWDLFRGRVAESGGEESPPQNKNFWMPSESSDSELSWREWIEKLIPYRYQFTFLAPHLRDWKEGLRVGRFQNSTLRFVDVRSGPDFEKFNLKQLDEKFPLISIPWNRFFDEQGFFQAKMRGELNELDWKEEDEIVVLSEDGVSSGAVTYALHQLGFSKAVNFSGGYETLQAHLKNPRLEKSLLPETPKSAKKSIKKKSKSKNRSK